MSVSSLYFWDLVSRYGEVFPLNSHQELIFIPLKGLFFLQMALVSSIYFLSMALPGISVSWGQSQIFIHFSSSHASAWAQWDHLVDIKRRTEGQGGKQEYYYCIIHFFSCWIYYLLIHYCYFNINTEVRSYQREVVFTSWSQNSGVEFQPCAELESLSPSPRYPRQTGGLTEHPHVSHRPFSVEPTVATLDVGESMQLEVEFEPQSVGNHSERLLVYYDTGMLYSL